MLSAGRLSYSDKKRDIKERLGNVKEQSGCEYAM